MSIPVSVDTENTIQWPSEINRNGFVFKAITVADFDLLYSWLNAPHIAAEWGGGTSKEGVERKYTGKIQSSSEKAYIVYSEGLPLGYIQVYQAAEIGGDWWPDMTASIVGVDQFIGIPEKLDQGLGSSFLRAFTDYLLEQKETLHFITDPSPKNLRAIKAYEKAGFAKVGLIDTPEGEVMLMEKKRRDTNPFLLA